MPEGKKVRAVPAQRQPYPNNCNAAGVPLLGQTIEQTVNDHAAILDAMTQDERAAFEHACAQARCEVELWEETTMARTKARERQREAPTCLSVVKPAPDGEKPKSSGKHSRERLVQAARFHIKVQYKNGLHLELYLGPVWVNVLISMLCAIGLPQLEPILKYLTHAHI